MGGERWTCVPSRGSKALSTDECVRWLDIGAARLVLAGTSGYAPCPFGCWHGMVCTRVTDGEGVASVLSDLQHVRARLVVAVKAEKVSCSWPWWLESNRAHAR